MTDINSIVAPVVRVHVESAAFQWAQRDTLAHEDPVDEEALAWVDARLEANIDAIRIAGAAAWPFIIDAFEDYPEKGELFVTAVLALETRDKKRLEQAVTFARVADGGPRGLCGAFEWLLPLVTAPVVREWVDATDPVKLEAALSAVAGRNGLTDVGLEALLQHDFPSVRSAAQRLISMRRGS